MNDRRKRGFIRSRRSGIAAVLLVAVAFFSGTHSAAASTFETTKCWFAVPRDRDMTCGFLTVPENRTKPDGATIRIAVAIFEPDRERHEPVVFLSGGPGQSAGIRTDDDVESWWRFIGDEPWLRGRRLIAVDQRGTGLSQPSLDCTAYFTPDVWNRTTLKPDDAADFDALQKQEVNACRKALAGKGIDLSAFNTRENAADIADLRAALGIGRWVIYGVSYGTEVGLEVLDRHPQGIAAAVLDSVLPPDVDYLGADGKSLDRLLLKLDEDCGRDAGCRGHGPKLRVLVESIVTAFDAQPLLLRLGGTDGEKLRYTRIAGDDFLDVLFEQFYDHSAIEMLPSVIRSTFDQDYGPLSALVAESAVETADLGIADGMDFSVTCTETEPGKPALATSRLLEKWADSAAYSWICPIWLGGGRLASQPRPATIDVPVLMLSGDYDPATPPDWARGLVKRMPKGRFVLFSGIGHDVIDSDACGGEVVADFLADPSKPIRTACLSHLGPPQFTPSDRTEPQDDPGVAATDVMPLALTGK